MAGSSASGSSSVRRPLRDICDFLCQQVRIEEQVNVKAIFGNGQTVYAPLIKAEGFFVSEGRSRDTAFYKTVSSLLQSLQVNYSPKHIFNNKHESPSSSIIVPKFLNPAF